MSATIDLHPIQLFFKDVGRNITQYFRDHLVANYRDEVQTIIYPLKWFLYELRNFLEWIPIPIAFAIFIFFAYKIVGKRFAVWSFVLYGLMWAFDLWNDMMVTYAMMIVALTVCIVIGIPIGIWGGKSKRAWRILKPTLDILQVVPTTVYLIPVVMFFGIGIFPGTMCVILFAIVPIAKLTAISIQEVPRGQVEAAHSVGLSKFKTLTRVEIPQSLYGILCGLNQTIMMALGMVVIAGIIGAGGIGSNILTAISRIDIGAGVINGVAITWMAIYLDKLTIGIANKYAR